MMRLENGLIKVSGFENGHEGGTESGGDFENGGQDAGLSDGQDFGSYRSTECVGDVVGADAEGQDKGHDESCHYDPQDVRRRNFYH